MTTFLPRGIKKMTALFNNKYCRVDHVCYDDQSSCEFVLDYDKVVLAVEELKKKIAHNMPDMCVESLGFACTSCKFRQYIDEVFGSVKK